MSLNWNKVSILINKYINSDKYGFKLLNISYSEGDKENNNYNH